MKLGRHVHYELMGRARDRLFLVRGVKPTYALYGGAIAVLFGSPVALHRCPMHILRRCKETLPRMIYVQDNRWHSNNKYSYQSDRIGHSE